jgi:hypothetical protein
MATPDPTRFEIDQSARTVSGQLIGASISHLAGDLIIDNVQDDPPSIESVAAYLEAICSQELALPGVSERVRKLWAPPYRAHAPGPAADEPEDLYAAVHRTFVRDRTLGHQRVVLLADGGMGKTPALKHLQAERAQRSYEAYAAYREQKETDGAAPPAPDAFVVPLMIDLGNLDNGVTLYSLLRDVFNACVTPDRTQGVDEMGLDQVLAFLNTYCCLILFDELDELIANRRSAGLHLVRRFMDTHPEHQYIITCRTANYREQLGNLETLYLKDLDEVQAREVLGDQEYDRLSQALQQLARNRGLLSQILALQEDVTLLRNKGQLLRLHMQQRVAQVSADDWERPHVSLLRRVLEHLALAMHRDHTLRYTEWQTMEVTRACLERWHEHWHWRQVLYTLQELGLLQRDDERNEWRFAGRSDQAYFAAAALARAPDQLPPILDQVSDYWWREMFEILVGLLPDPTALFFELMDRDALIAANSVQYAGLAGHGYVTNAVLDALVERLGVESSARRRYIVERIGESAHPRVPEALFLALHRDGASLVLKTIARTLCGWSQRQDGTKLAEAEAEALAALRGEFTSVAWMIDLYGAGMSAGIAGQVARRKLVDTLQNPDQPHKVRGLAAILLGLLASAGYGGETTCPLLQELFRQPDIEDLVGWCVVEGLIECRRADVEGMAVSFRQDESYRGEAWRHHRARAAYLLGWVAREEHTCDLLWKTLQDPDPLVRGFAIDAIARLDLPGARQEIQRLMTDAESRETDHDVLRRMAEALAQIGTIDSIPALQRHLRHERTRTRRTVRKAIDEIRQRYGLQLV